MKIVWATINCTRSVNVQYQEKLVARYVSQQSLLYLDEYNWLLSMWIARKLVVRKLIATVSWGKENRLGYTNWERSWWHLGYMIIGYQYD